MNFPCSKVGVGVLGALNVLLMVAVAVLGAWVFRGSTREDQAGASGNATLEELLQHLRRRLCVPEPGAAAGNVSCPRRFPPRGPTGREEQKNGKRLGYFTWIREKRYGKKRNARRDECFPASVHEDEDGAGSRCRLRPRGWLPFGDRCYWVSEEVKRWRDGCGDCETKRSRLLVLRDREEMGRETLVPRVVVIRGHLRLHTRAEVCREFPSLRTLRESLAGCSEGDLGREKKKKHQEINARYVHPAPQEFVRNVTQAAALVWIGLSAESSESSWTWADGSASDRKLRVSEDLWRSLNASRASDKSLLEPSTTRSPPKNGDRGTSRRCSQPDPLRGQRTHDLSVKPSGKSSPNPSNPGFFRRFHVKGDAESNGCGVIRKGQINSESCNAEFRWICQTEAILL
nr:PREDICTED: uncharacterized protein LOC106489068 [Apteryx mantelli mantelli]